VQQRQAFDTVCTTEESFSTYTTNRTCSLLRYRKSNGDCCGRHHKNAKGL